MKREQKGKWAESSAPTTHERGMFLGITALKPPAYSVKFLPLFISLLSDLREALKMRSRPKVDLFINSLEEHHELQEGNFLHTHPPKHAASVNTVAHLNLLSLCIRRL